VAFRRKILSEEKFCRGKILSEEIFCRRKFLSEEILLLRDVKISSGVDEDSSLLGSYAVLTGKEQPIFRKEVIYPSSDLTDRSTTHIRKVGNYAFLPYVPS
jgi:hypothetical protein